MFCKNCGIKLNENAAFCPNCGTPVNNEKSSIQSNNIQTESKKNKKVPVIISCIVGVFMVAAIVAGIFLMNKSQTPKEENASVKVVNKKTAAKKNEITEEEKVDGKLPENELLEVYLAYQKKAKEDDWFSCEEGSVYGLCFAYLDDDDIPELLLALSGGDGEYSAIVSFVDGEVVESGTIESVGVSYIEKGNRVCFSGSAAGYGDVFKVVNVNKGKCTIKEDGRIMSDEYRWNDTVISEREYNEKKKAVYDESEGTTIEYKDTFAEAWRAFSKTTAQSEIKDTLDLYLAFEESVNSKIDEYVEEWQGYLGNYGPEEVKEDMSYRFVYLDDDDIPELISYYSNISDDCIIFSYSDGSVTSCSLNSIRFINSLYYREKEGNIRIEWSSPENIEGSIVEKFVNHSVELQDVFEHDLYNGDYDRWNDVPITFDIYTENIGKRFDMTDATCIEFDEKNLASAYEKDVVEHVSSECGRNPDFEKEYNEAETEFNLLKNKYDSEMAQLDEALAAYTEKLNAYNSAEYEIVGYDVIYINDDVIPDICVWYREGEWMGSNYTVLCYQNGKVAEFSTGGSMIVLSYLEKSGMLMEYQGGHDGADDYGSYGRSSMSFYRLEDDGFVSFCDCEERHYQNGTTRSFDVTNGERQINHVSEIITGYDNFEQLEGKYETFDSVCSMFNR